MNNYITLGDLARAFFKALDIKYSIEVRRLCKEDNIDMGKIKNKILKYYKELEIYDSRFDSFTNKLSENLKPLKISKELSTLTNELLIDLKEIIKISEPVDDNIDIRNNKLLLNKNMVNTIADNFFYIYKFYNDIIKNYGLTKATEKRNNIFINNLYIPILRRIFIEFEKKHKLELLFNYNDLQKDIFKEIIKNILKKSGLENYTFLKNGEDDSLYRFVNTLGKKHNSNEKLLEVSEELIKNKKILKSGISKETILLNFILARLYKTFLKEVAVNIDTKNNYFKSTDLIDIFYNLDYLSRMPSDIKIVKQAKKMDELKKLVLSNQDSKNIKDFENLYKTLKKESTEFDWFLEHCYSKHLVFQNKYNQALEKYLKNLKEASYKGGPLLKKYLKESMTLAIYLNNKVAFKKIYAKAYLHLFTKNTLEEEWDLYMKKNTFLMNYHFPKHCYYKI